MYDLLIKLMFIASLTQIGVSVSDFGKCHSRECVAKIEKHSRDILRVEWKAISIFPDEAKRFR